MNYKTQNASLFDLLPEKETPTARPDRFYAWRLAKLKAIHAKRQLQKVSK